MGTTWWGKVGHALSLESKKKFIIKGARGSLVTSLPNPDPNYSTPNFKHFHSLNKYTVHSTCLDAHLNA